MAKKIVLRGLLGISFAAASVIWEIGRWGIVKQSGVYFFLVSVCMLPAAYLMYWMEHSVGGFLSYFWVFALIFAVIWVVQVLIGRHFVKELKTGCGI